MPAPAFGFSVGDFLAAVKLLNKAAKALREAPGAKNQFHHAAVEIESIHDLLNRVQSLTPKKCGEDIIRKIHICALSCHIPLARFISKLQKLEPHLGSVTNTKTWKGIQKKFSTAQRKLQWAFTLESELKKLKEQLGLQFAAIAIWLQMEALERAAESHQSSQSAVSEMTRCTASVQATVQELKTTVTAMSTTREPARDEHIVFESARQRGEKQLEKFCRKTQSDNARLRADFVVVQEMLVDLKQQIRDVGRPRQMAGPPSNADDSDTMTASDQLQIETAKEPSLVTVKDVANLFAIISSIRQRIEQILLAWLLLMPSITRIYRSFQLMSRLPSLLLKDNITLEDALGRTLSLPYEHFRKWSAFVAKLRSEFTGMPGELKVQSNHFYILNTQLDGPPMFTSDSWERHIFPGARLAMSMVYRTNVRNTACPRCRAVNVNASSASWLQCSACLLRYRVFRQQRPSTFHALREIPLEARGEIGIQVDRIWACIWALEGLGSPRLQMRHLSSAFTSYSNSSKIWALALKIWAQAAISHRPFAPSDTQGYKCRVRAQATICRYLQAPFDIQRNKCRRVIGAVDIVAKCLGSVLLHIIIVPSGDQRELKPLRRRP